MLPKSVTVEQIDRIAGIPVNRVGSTIQFTAGLMVDADGCPCAYHPDPSKGLEYLANAGYPNHPEWYKDILVCDLFGKPVVQGLSDPAPGYFISATALQYAQYGKRDPRRYVNACTVPFVVLPSVYIHWPGVKLGAKGTVRNAVAGQHVDVIFADVGPRAQIGEASIATAAALGVDSDPKHGGSSRLQFEYTIQLS